MTKSLTIIISVVLLASVITLNQDVFATEQKQTTEKPYKDSHASTKSWFYSITLPDGWSEKDDLPFYYASAETDGNPIIIGYNVYAKKSFASRDDLHSYLKSTEYLPIGQFGLSNSIMTFDTKYGYKTIIQFKFQKQDGDQVMIRKDFHFMKKEGNLYSVQGFSSDVDSFKEIKKTLDHFKPVA